MNILPIGTIIYFYSEQDKCFCAGVLVNIVTNFDDSPRYYALSGYKTLGNQFIRYYQRAYISVSHGFATLKEAEVDRMIDKIKGET